MWRGGASDLGGLSVGLFLFILLMPSSISFFFFFNDTATTEIYTLSLHDALPISWWSIRGSWESTGRPRWSWPKGSEEHTSELQSRLHLVCRLLLEKKKSSARTS